MSFGIVLIAIKQKVPKELRIDPIKAGTLCGGKFESQKGRYTPHSTPVFSGYVRVEQSRTPEILTCQVFGIYMVLRKQQC